MNHLPLIIKREYLTKVKNKSFLIMTILSPLIMIALMAVVGYLSQLNNNKQRTISVLDESGILVDVFKNTENTKYDVLAKDLSLENAKAVVKQQDNYGLLYIASFDSISNASDKVQFFSEDSPSLSIISSLESKIEKKLRNAKLVESGVDLKMIENSKVNVLIKQENFSGEKTSKIDSVFKLAFGG